MKSVETAGATTATQQAERAQQPKGGGAVDSSNRLAWGLIVLVLFAAPCVRSVGLQAPDPTRAVVADREAQAVPPTAARAAAPYIAAMAARLAPLLPRDEARQAGRALVAACGEYEISMEFAMAVIEVESGYDPFAISHAGAVGLMQVMPRTGAEVAQRIGMLWRGTATLFDPSSNVRIGLAYLRQLLDRYRDVRVALAAYNWGPGRVDIRLRRGGPIPALYADRVLAAYSRSTRNFLGS